MTYKTRKRWAIAILVVGVPAYVVACVTVMNWLYPDPLTRPSIFAELGIYVVLGIVWALPLKRVFRGIGQADPDMPDR